MSEDEHRKITGQDEETDEVEAHNRKIHATDEAADADGSEDDFEAHHRRSSKAQKN